MTEEEYWYWFCNIKDMWQGKMDKIMRIYKHPKELFGAKYEQLMQIKYIKSQDVQNIIESRQNLQNLEELETLAKKEIAFIYYGHKEYPQKLTTLFDKPYCLFVKGKLPNVNQPIVAMVGSRNCSNYGKEIAKNLAGQLATVGVQVISGFARGIDSYSQWGAISNGGSCFGVLGCGIDICYPKENIELYCLTTKNGGILSEYPIGTKPLAWRFPHRNRLISGFADKLIIVEAKEKSGSCITVECALEQGKDVYAIPGRITDPLSVGCNKLIKEGAQILTDIHDLYENLPKINQKSETKYTNNNISLEKDFEVVYSCVDLLPKNLQDIIEESGLNGREVIRILVELEIMDLVIEPIKNYYSKKI